MRDVLNNEAKMSQEATHHDVDQGKCLSGNRYSEFNGRSSEKYLRRSIINNRQKRTVVNTVRHNSNTNYIKTTKIARLS